MISYKNFKILLVSVILAVSTASCSRSTSISDQYSTNYPEYTLEPVNREEKEEDLTKSQGQSIVIIKEYLDEVEQKTLSSSTIVRQNLEPESTLIDYESSFNTGYLEDIERTQYADDELPVEAQNTTTFIEGKLFNLVEQAYIRRDEREFKRLYNFFLETFPNTTRRSFLEEFRQSFFYTEGLNVDALEGTIVEFSFPESNSWESLNIYFSKLNRNGVAAIQVPILQLMGQRVYLFSKSQNTQGYYFKARQVRIVDNVLEKLVLLAHDNNLKVFASFPLRNHPQLNERSEYIMDDVWDPVQNRMFTNGKLDLLNPQGVRYLKGLLDDLLKTDIDGVIFRDDFTYELDEGFSEVARNRYRFQTGRNIDVESFLVAFKAKKKGEIGVLASSGFNAYIDWKTREIKQSLWEIIDHIKEVGAGLTIGLEVTPEMLMDEDISKKWYSTGLRYIKDLRVDLFVLKKRKFNSIDEIDEEQFSVAANLLDRNINEGSSLFMKVELSKETNNVIRLNQKINSLKEVFTNDKDINMAIGPIDRIENWSLLKYTRSDQPQNL